MQTIIYRCINNKVSLYSTESSIQDPMINHNGKEYEKVYSGVCVCVCVCIWITLLYSRNEYNIVNQLYFSKIIILSF